MPDHCRVGDRWVSQEQGLQFGRRHLVAVDLDQFLEPVEHDDVALGVDVAEIAGVQPASGSRISAEAAGWFRYPAITCGPVDPEFAGLTRADGAAGPGVDHHRFGVRQKSAYGAGWARVMPVWNADAGGRLGQAPPLRDDAARQAGGQCLGPKIAPIMNCSS